jgi:hypothetical protein
MKEELTIERGTIGRTAVIVHGDECFTAQVIDNIAGTDRPKRVRIINDASKGGTVLMPSQYTFKDWADDD